MRGEVPNELDPKRFGFRVSGFGYGVMRFVSSEMTKTNWPAVEWLPIWVTKFQTSSIQNVSGSGLGTRVSGFGHWW